MKSRVLSMLAIAAVLCCGFAEAQIPRKLNYQGFLTTPSGSPLNTPQTLIVRLYDAASGGNLLFAETHNPVTVSNGIFNILLGSVDTNLNALNLLFDKQYYLGITVGADPEMSPRQPLAASPYAITAQNIASGGNIVLSNPSSATAGNIMKGSSRLVHGVGSANTFIGEDSGNFTLSGGSNTGIGFNSLSSNSSGGQNTSAGRSAMLLNNAGSNNTALGYSALGNNTNGHDNIAIGYAAGVSTGSSTFGNIMIGNAGLAADNLTIRIGTSQTDTFLTGIVHGNGSGLTNVPVNITNGSITSAMTGTGAAQFVRTIQVPNNFVPPGQAFTIDTQVFNSVPASIVASAGAGGTVFTLGATGTYMLDYEMSLSSASSIGVYTGPNAVALVLDTNSIAGSSTAATWIHGRTLVATGASPVVVAISPVVGVASVTTAGTASGNYMIRLTVLKI